MERSTALQIEHLDQTNVTEFAGLNVVAGGEIVRCATILGAHLYHAFVFAGGLHELAAFPNVVAKRFLDVDILARLTSKNSCRRMPVVGCGHDHGINVLVGENLLHVRGEKRFVAALLLGDEVGSAHQSLLVDITNLGADNITARSQARSDLCAAASAANQGNLDTVIGAERFAKRRETYHG